MFLYLFCMSRYSYKKKMKRERRDIRRQFKKLWIYYTEWQEEQYISCKLMCNMTVRQQIRMFLMDYLNYPKPDACEIEQNLLKFYNKSIKNNNAKDTGIF